MRSFISADLVNRSAALSQRWLDAKAPVKLAIVSVTVMAAGLTRAALSPWVGDGLAYATFYPVVALAAFLGGPASGLFAAVASVVLTHLWLVPLASVADVLGLVLFLVNCGLVSALAAMLHLLRAPSSAVARRKAAECAHVAPAPFEIPVPEGETRVWAFHVATAAAGDGIYGRSQTLLEVDKPARAAASCDASDEVAAACAFRERAQLSEQLASIALAAPGVMGTFFIDPAGHVAYRYVSPKAQTVFGLKAEDICADARHFFRRLRAEDLDSINEGLFRSAREMSMWSVDFLFDHPEKGMVWLEAQAAPVREPDGLIVWHGYASDVTERKLFEISLAETAARLQATIDGAQDAVLTMDADGRILSVNKAGAEIFGYRADEMTGLNLCDLVSPSSEETLSLSAERLGARCDVRGRRSNGVAFPAELTVSEAKSIGERLLVGFVRDLAAQRRIEARVERLRQDRLDAMGGMTATLAHEINQPLSATATYLRVARRLLEKTRHPDLAEVMDVLDKAATQTLRAGRIVTSLRDLVQRGEPDKTLLSLHAVIREVHAIVLAESPSCGVAIRLDCQAERDQIVADRVQLRQVLGNLIRNAIEAMQSTDRRELVVSTSNPDLMAIQVDVRDTGCGISVGEDCFEPFATTKAKGMGIGLSISRSIIEAHYGRIWAKPNAGGGAVFSFTLPLQDSEVDL